tara:strand:- start:727 stop:924 length:198 start_codon:yes stop_codon:yes gene_type:complete
VILSKEIQNALIKLFRLLHNKAMARTGYYLQSRVRNAFNQYSGIWQGIQPLLISNHHQRWRSNAA